METYQRICKSTNASIVRWLNVPELQKNEVSFEISVWSTSILHYRSVWNSNVMRKRLNILFHGKLFFRSLSVVTDSSCAEMSTQNYENSWLRLFWDRTWTTLRRQSRYGSPTCGVLWFLVEIIMSRNHTMCMFWLCCWPCRLWDYRTIRRGPWSSWLWCERLPWVTCTQRTRGECLRR